MAQAPKKTVLPTRIGGKARSATAATQYKRGNDIPNQDLLSYVDGNTVRNLRDTNKIIAALRLACRLDGTLSTAVFDMVAIANTEVAVKAYDSTTHQFSPEGTAAAKQVLALMDTLYDYTKGYSDRRPLEGVKETILRESILTGAVAGELVLDKARMPDRLQVVPFETITFKSKGDGRKFPVQRGLSSKEIPLDQPNFWVIESHLGADSPYPRSMMEAALPMSFYYAEFIEDMRRVVRRTGHKRTIFTLDAERVQLAAPEKAKKSDEAMKAHMEGVREELQTLISGLEPEEALVVYDVAQSQELATKGEKADYADLLKILAGMTATSLKSNSSVLGIRAEGSQSLSNTESLVFLKVAASAQVPASGFLSRAMTLAVRLYGHDVYVKAKFRPIALRPDDELEPYRVMMQDRILDLHSLGFYTDEEVADILGTPRRDPSLPPLSGTMYRDSAGGNRADEVSPNADPMGRAMSPNTPKKGGGRSQ